MRSMRLGVLGVFLFCSLGLARDARAADPLWPDAGDIYQYLKWEFSVPVKLNNMMDEVKKMFIEVKVYSADGDLLGMGRNMINLLPEGPNIDTVVVVTVDPAVGKNPTLAKKYTVDMTFDNGEIPGFNNPKISYRTKEGTELVNHIEQPMPEMPSAGTGGVGTGTIGEPSRPKHDTLQ